MTSMILSMMPFGYVNHCSSNMNLWSIYATIYTEHGYNLHIAQVDNIKK
jgi:hypothetical protein